MSEGAGHIDNLDPTLRTTEAFTGALVHNAQFRYNFDMYIAQMFPTWYETCLNPSPEQIAELEQEGGPGAVKNRADLSWESGEDLTPEGLSGVTNNFVPGLTTFTTTLRARSPETQRYFDDLHGQDRDDAEQFGQDAMVDGAILWRNSPFDKTIAKRPAYARALVLVPELIQTAHVSFSEAMHGRGTPGQSEIELKNLHFATYHCIAACVDVDDPYVTRDDGTVDTGYLFR